MCRQNVFLQTQVSIVGKNHNEEIKSYFIQLVINFFFICRRYPTVEKKAKLCGGDKYVRVLPDPQMARLLLQEVSCGPSDRKVGNDLLIVVGKWYMV